MKKFSQNSSTRKKDIKIYNERLKSITHDWVKQILGLILYERNLKKKVKINDIGCNLFQFYKGLKTKNKKKRFDYFGYDHDKKYIKYGLNFFPELKRKSKVFDIEKGTPRLADITIISATLEHLNNPDNAIDKLCRSTKKIIFIRSFFGKKKIIKIFKNKKYIDNPYYINQYSFKWMINKLKAYNFTEIKFMKDKATKGKMKNIWPSIKRRFYIVQASKVINK